MEIEDHTDTEDRYQTLGPISGGLVMVVWTERSGDTIRIISARLATRFERDLYLEYVTGNS